METRTLVLVSSLAALLACSDGIEVGHDLPTTGGAGTGAGPGAGAASSDGGGTTSGSGGAPAVTGTAIRTHVTDTGVILHPFKASADFASAVFPGPSGDEIQYGVNDAAGNLTIDGVPLGPYQLRFSTGPRYFVRTEAREVDVSPVYVGRPNFAQPAAGTEVVLEVTNLAPWDPEDQLVLSSLGADAYIFGLTDGIVEGETDATVEFDFEYAALMNGVIDGGQGDVTRALHYEALVSSGVIQRELRRAATLPASFALVDGQVVLADAPLVELPLEQLVVDWHVAAFTDMRASMHPAGSVAEVRMSVVPNPSGAASQGDLVPDLAHAYAEDPIDALLDLSYGNPYDPAWPLLLRTCTQIWVNLHDTEGNTGPGFSWACTQRPLQSGDSDPLAPLVHPPRDILVAGQDALQPLEGVGLTPTISWSPPIEGAAPAGYEIWVWQNEPLDLVAILSTDETSVIIPDGVLESDRSFWVSIGSWTDRHDARPLVTPDEVGWAEAVAGMFRP